MQYLNLVQQLSNYSLSVVLFKLVNKGNKDKVIRLIQRFLINIEWYLLIDEYEFISDQLDFFEHSSEERYSSNLMTSRS